MIAVLQNELRLLARDRAAILWLLVAPIVFITLVSAARFQSGEGPRLLVPVVDEDQGPIARAFVKLLRNRADAVEMSRAQAESLVRDRGRAAAALVFPAGLSKRYLQGRQSELLLLTDPAEPVGVRRVKVALLLMDREAADLADPVGEPRLTFVEQNLTGERIKRKSHEQNVPGFTIMFTLLATVYGTAEALHLVAQSGVLQRLLVAPIGLGRALAGKLGARLLVAVVQMLTLLWWGRLIFGISLGSSVWALLTMVVATAFAAVSLGALVAGIARSGEQVVPLTLALVLPLSAIGGLWWPLHLEPAWMQAAAPLAAPTWAMRGMTDLVLRDRGLASVWLPAAVLLLQGTVVLLVGLALLRVRFGAGRRPLWGWSARRAAAGRLTNA